MKLTMLFGILFAVCIIGYLTVYGLVVTNPAMGVGLSLLMMPLGWGILIFGVGLVVCFILKR